MSNLVNVIEQKIAGAMRNGEFEQLPGAGKPLDLSDDPFTPEGMGIAYKVLKNAGYVPCEVEMIREVAQLRERLGSGANLTPVEHERLVRELRIKEADVNTRLERLRKK